MKSLIKAIALILAMIAFAFTVVAGIVMCLHIIFKKENMIQIVDQYMMNTENGDGKSDDKQDAKWNDIQSVYEILDSGSASGINTIISNPNLLKLMESYGSIANMTEMSNSGAFEISQLGGGFSGIISGFGTAMKVIKGEYGLVSLMLNMADSNELLSAGLIDKVLSDGEVAKYYVAPENADELKEAFLHTKLASHMTLEATYVYYDYFNSAKSGEDWEQRLRASLTERVNEREQDLSFIVGHGITEEDRPLIDSLKKSLVETMISNMTAPADKAAALPGGTHMALNLFFADRIVIALFVIALIIVALIFVMCHDTGKGPTYFGFIMIFAGIFLAVVRLMKNHVIGPFYNESASEFKAMSFFLIIGGAFALFGVFIMVLPELIGKIKHKIRTRGSKLDANVPSFAEVNAISQMGLGDLVVKNSSNKNRRADGLVDYYGDGRGLHAQLEYKKRKEEAEKDNSNDGFGYPPDDDGTY